MTDVQATSVQIYEYNGKVRPELLYEANEAFRTYKSEKEKLMNRIKDDEAYYRNLYTRSLDDIKKNMRCDTSFIFSGIENALADASENYPVPNILARSAKGEKAAEKISKVLPVILDRVCFKKSYKTAVRDKLKYGTAVYGAFYDNNSGDIDIRSIDITDIYVDMHISDIQDSSFVFVAAAVPNEVLKRTYPKHKKLFVGEAQIENLMESSYTLKNRSLVLDCYYKKPDGTVHMMKLCKDNIIQATEDMEGYENGLYAHGLYPFVFDVLYPEKHCPFGFGMIDIGKGVQTSIDNIDSAITENILVNTKPRYLTKRNGGISEDEFRDYSKNIVHYEGETDAIKAIEPTVLNANSISHREIKKDELKEILANRDFQQGSTSGGVTAASAIEALQQSGEKRSRSMIDDTYERYKSLMHMVIELIRQFYNEKKSYRTKDSSGKTGYETFSNEDMYASGEYDPVNGYSNPVPIEFDIDVVAQRENPYTREQQNNTLLTLWSSGLININNYEAALVVLKNMNFDGKDRLISDFESLHEEMLKQAQQMQQAQQAVPAEAQAMPGEELVPVNIGAENKMVQAETESVNTEDELVPVEITGGL